MHSLYFWYVSAVLAPQHIFLYHRKAHTIPTATFGRVQRTSKRDSKEFSVAHASPS